MAYTDADLQADLAILKNNPQTGLVVRQAIARISEDMINSSTDQIELFNDLLNEYTENGNGSQTTAEIVAARNGETNLKTRLDKKEQEVTAQLAQTDIKTNTNTLSIQNLGSKVGDLGATSTFKGSATNAVIIAKTGMSIGDEWFDTTNNQSLRWNGTSWSIVGGTIKLGKDSVTVDKIANHNVAKDKLQGLETNNSFNINEIQVGFILKDDGSITTSSHLPNRYFVTGFIPVKPNTLYETNFNRVRNWLSEYDSEKNFIKHTEDWNTVNKISTFKTIPTTKFIRMTVNSDIISEYDFYIIKSGDKLKNNLKWLTIDESNLPEGLFDNVNPELERFENLKLFVSGDSITEKNIRATKNWHDYLSDWLKLGSVINDGKSGTGLVKGFNSDVGLVNRVENWTTDLDLILIMGAMNDGTSGELGDVVQGLPVGSFTDAAGTTSVYAAMHKLMQDLIAKYPNKPIGFISSTPRSQIGARGKCWGIDGWFEEYDKAYKEVCSHYSIPFLDLYHQSGLRPWNETNNSTYFSSETSPNGDGIHPNSLGQEEMAKKILSFMKQFM